MKRNTKPSDLMDKRPSCLAFAMLLQLMVGLNYAFTVFQIPLMEKFNIPLSTVSLLASLAGVLGMFFSLFMANKLRTVLGFRTLVMAGGLLYGFSFFVTGFNSGSVFFLFVTLLILRGFGGMMVDLPIKSYATELYPDRSGWASGMTTAAFGAAAILWAPLVTALLTRVGNLSVTFFIIGISLMLLMTFFSSRLIAVPADFHLSFQHGKTAVGPDRYYNVNRKQLLRLPMFYLFLVCLTLALASGNALIAQCSYFMQALLGTSAESAALAVSALALSNMVGRLVCGSIADRIGKMKTAFFTQVISTVGLVACALAPSAVTFTVAAMVVIFCFGGLFSLLSPLNGEIFGYEHMTENFPLFFLIANFAVLLGPTLTSAILDRTFSLPLAMFACAVVSAAGVLLMALIMKKLKQVELANAA